MSFNKKTSNAQALNIDITSMQGKEGINMQELNMIPAKIESVETFNYGQNGEEMLRLVIKTNILKKDTKITATEFVSLFRDDKGEVVYSISEKSKATKILNFFKVQNFKELIGKDCKTLLRISTTTAKQNLGIYYG